MEKLERFLGSMLGLAVGDAVGTTVEFQPKGSFPPVQDMIGGGPFSLKPGQWTDDTSMALCLTESLLECKGMNLAHQLEKYTAWLNEGYLSSTGYCFDIGNATLQALSNYKRTKNPYSGPAGEYDAGNGSIMRLAPVALLYSYDLPTNLEMCAESSRTTHQAKEAVDGCQLLGGLIHGALQGLSKDELLSAAYIDSLKNHTNWSAAIAKVAYGSYKQKEEEEIEGTGYVVKTLEAVLWAFYHTSSFTGGLLKVVNLGDDADTTAAVYGQLAGAYYGINSIPEKWVQQLTFKEKIYHDIEELFTLHQKLATTDN